MQHEIEGNILVAKLDDGTDLFDSLREIFREPKCGMVVSGIGMLKDFKLGYYNTDEEDYEWEEFSDCMELLSLSGSVTADDTIHLHAVVSGRDHGAKGGHLEGGTIHNVVELTGVVFKNITLLRVMDDIIGSDLLSIV